MSIVSSILDEDEDEGDEDEVDGEVDDDEDDDVWDGDDELLEDDCETLSEEDELLQLALSLSAEYVRTFFGFKGCVSSECPVPL